MNDSSRSRKIGINGSHTAPARSTPSAIVTNSRRLGSWNATGSPGSTPSRPNAAATRVGVVLQSSPGQLAHRSVGADLDDGSLARPLAGVSVQIAEDHMAGTVPDTAAGTPRAFMWSRNSG